MLHGHSDEVHWIEPIPGSADFVTGAYDGRVIVWQAPGYAPRVVFRAPRGRVRLVRPSPDGARLAIGSDDHGAHAGAVIAANRLAVALDDGAIVIETLGPHTLDQLTAVLARATTVRAPVGR